MRARRPFGKLMRFFIDLNKTEEQGNGPQVIVALMPKHNKVRQKRDVRRNVINSEEIVEHGPIGM